MRVMGTEIYQDLMVRGGHIYVCGDVSMAEDVNKTLKVILADNGVADADSVILSLKVTMTSQQNRAKLTICNDHRTICATTKTSLA